MSLWVQELYGEQPEASFNLVLSAFSNSYADQGLSPPPVFKHIRVAKCLQLGIVGYNLSLSRSWGRLQAQYLRAGDLAALLSVPTT